MRYLMIVKATEMSERGEFPPDAEKMFADMAEYTNELIAAGVMLDGAGLKPSSAGKRIAFHGRGNTVVTDGPFAETKELVAGFWILNVKDEAEALSWGRRVPFEDGEIELRPYHEPEDFEGLVTEEVMAQEKGWRDEQAAKAPKASA
jgi:hypothetical protein